MGYKWYGPALWADLIRYALGRKVPRQFRWLPFVRQSEQATERLKQAARDLAASGDDGNE
jgi:hypothetical protein